MLTYKGNAIKIVSPYSPKMLCYRGQIHCHTTNSDGADSPTDIVTAYKNAGYSFVAITDHDILTSTPSVSGIYFIPGVEEKTDPAGNASGHIGHLNAINAISSSDAQEILDVIASNKSIAILNHPNLYTGQYQIGWTEDELISLTDFLGIEIYNQVSGGYANAEDKWDYLLTRRHKAFGFSVDDCHDISGAAFNKGSIHVFLDTPSVTSILDGIVSGNFYSTYTPSGSHLYMRIIVDGNKIIAYSNETCTIEFISCGEARQSSSGVAAIYTIFGDEIYIRVRLTTASGKKAWSNPIYIERLNEYDLQKGGTIRGNLVIDGNLTVTGTINGS